jgi:hypothetical protein
VYTVIDTSSGLVAAGKTLATTSATATALLVSAIEVTLVL